MLILFDIDGTLLRARGIGLRSMEEALLELHGIPVDTSTIKCGGRLDPHIFREISEKHDLPTHDDALIAFRDAYVARMAHAFDMDTWSNALPGAVDLVHRVHLHPELTCALMTGNIEPTSWMKIQDAGFERDWFEFGVFGDEGATRRDLPTVARARHRELTGEELPPNQIVVIGDTEHDIDCAHHCGCRAVAVASGMSPIEELRRHQPELLLESLVDGDHVMQALQGMMNRSGTTS